MWPVRTVTTACTVKEIVRKIACKGRTFIIGYILDRKDSLSGCLYWYGSPHSGSGKGSRHAVASMLQHAHTQPSKLRVNSYRRILMRTYSPCITVQ